MESNSNLNKMTIKNLSVLFTPALFHDHNQADNTGEWYSDKVLEDLIIHHETLFINVENQSRMIDQKQQTIDSPSASVLSLPFTSGGITRQASLSRANFTKRPTMPNTNANTNIATTNTTASNNMSNSTSEIPNNNTNV